MSGIPRMSRAALVMVAVHTAAAAALTGCAGEGGDDVGSPANGTATTTAGATVPAGQQRLNAVADRIRDLGQRRFPDVYSGVEVRAEEDVVIAYRRASADFDRSVRAEFPDAPVRFQDAPHAERELTTWAEQVRRDLPYWQARNTPVHGVVVRHDGTCVELHTMTVDEVRSHAALRYPGMPVCVVTGGPGWGATSPVAGR